MIKAFVRLNKKLSTFCEHRWPRIFGGDNCTSELMARIRSDIRTLKPGRIMECGGIDRPLLSKSRDFVYIGLDIENHGRCYSIYDEFHVQSVEEPIERKVDMIISTTLLEHVRNNRNAITQIFDCLSENGTTHHYMPSKNHPYSLILRLLGPKLQQRLIALLRPEASDVSGYPAFFDYCTPPKMTRLFEETGFTKINVRPFYRANDYFDFFFPAYILVTVFENFSRLLRWRFWCSGFVISAIKPAAR